MDVYPTIAGPNGETLTNCVSAVYWTCTGVDTDVNGNNIAASQIGSCNIPYIPDETYIEYSSLSQDEVLTWVWTYGSIRSATEEIVNQKLDALKNPPVTTTLPWA
jgi:hypothetical protein